MSLENEVLLVLAFPFILIGVVLGMVLLGNIIVAILEKLGLV